MSTEKQIEANRANAEHSTGPKTSAGKAKSRKNAWKHGLTAKSVMIGDEQPYRFARLRAELLAQYSPVGPVEQALVERLASVLWRLGRVPSFEAAVVNHYLERRREEFFEKLAYLEDESDEKESEGDEAEAEGDQWEEPKPDLGGALIDYAVAEDLMGKLPRYEANLMSSLTQTLQLLHGLKSQRDPKLVERALVETVALAPPK